MTRFFRRDQAKDFGLDIGMRADGKRLVLPFPELPHILVAGLTGSGKSSILNALLFALACLPNVAIVGIDLKQGMELGPWARRLTTFASTGEHVDSLFYLLRAEVERRQQFLQSIGHRKWRPEFGPWLVVVFDEFAELGVADLTRLIEATQLAHDTAGDRELTEMMKAARHRMGLRSGILESFARKCRALGVTIVAATQYPTADVVDTQVRSQFEIRFMCRVASKEQVKVCLGSGFEETIDVGDISPNQRGTFVCAGLTTKPFTARASWITDDTVAAQAEATAHLRIDPARLFIDQASSAGAGGGSGVVEPKPQAKAEPHPTPSTTNPPDLCPVDQRRSIVDADGVVWL